MIQFDNLPQSFKIDDTISFPYNTFKYPFTMEIQICKETGYISLCSFFSWYIFLNDMEIINMNNFLLKNNVITPREFKHYPFTLLFENIETLEKFIRRLSFLRTKINNLNKIRI